MTPDDPRLDDYLLECASTTELPKVCFLGTASGDSTDYIERFYNAFPPSRARATHFRCFRLDGRDPESLLLDQDIIHVGGGNTINMLAIWRAQGLDEVLRRAWEAGVVLSGLSAGAICWFESFTTDALGLADDTPKPCREGLGFLPGSVCPHFDDEPDRDPAFMDFVATGKLPGGIALPHGVAARYVGTELAEIVTCREDVTALEVKLTGDRAVTRTPLEARYLGPVRAG